MLDGVVVSWCCGVNRQTKIRLWRTEAVAVTGSSGPSAFSPPVRRLSNGNIAISETGLPNSVNKVEFAPDLNSPFQSVGTVTADSKGDFQFEMGPLRGGQ